MADGFYLGKLFDPQTEALGEPFLLRPTDLTTHGILIGMTGSGKTGLSIVLIEEAVRNGVPVIVIDPKGDMGNLALAFPDLSPAEFLPWIDTEAAAREGQTPDQAAEATASAWSKGLGDWGLGRADVADLIASRQVRIITPGSTAGLPLNLIESLDPPGAETMADEEDFRDQIDAVVTTLLGLVGIQADPIESREYILLATLVESAWRQGQGLSLESLIGQVASPPIDKVGALPLDVFYPPAERNRLMLSLNNLLASPQMVAWRRGEPVDIDAWLKTPDGKPRITIVYTSHLEEQQRVFVTALLLNKIVSWVRRQPGTGELRCLLYMDEIFGYFPPTANPPTKKPLITLLKQARAHGLGVLLSTQNPVDLDYRGLANMGFWAVGRLQTTQDQNRIRSGIEAALEDSTFGAGFDTLISGVQKRVFLIHDIHREAPALMQSRFAMSYLRGPITREEVQRLAGETAALTTTQSNVQVDVASAPPTTSLSAPPPLPAPLRPRFLNRLGGNVARPHLFVKAAVRYKTRGGAAEETVHTLAFPIDPSLSAAEVFSSEPMTVDEASITEQPPPDLRYGELPAYLSTNGLKTLERAMSDRLDDCFAVDLLYDPATKLVSQPGESVDSFALRVQNAPALASRRRQIETKLASKRSSLISRQQEVKARGMEKWASLGTSILSNISIFTGRKRSVTGIGGVLSKQRMESTARSRIEALQAEVARLEDDLDALSTVDPLGFESRHVKPARTDVSVIRYDIVWVT